MLLPIKCLEWSWVSEKRVGNKKDSLFCGHPPTLKCLSMSFRVLSMYFLCPLWYGFMGEMAEAFLYVPDLPTWSLNANWVSILLLLLPSALFLHLFFGWVSVSSCSRHAENKCLWFKNKSSRTKELLCLSVQSETCCNSLSGETETLLKAPAFAYRLCWGFLKWKNSLGK